MQPAEDVAAFLLDFLRRTPGQTLTGTQLAQVLRIAYKGFNPLEYGCSNIRSFVNKYVPSIKEIGSAGADRIYSLNAQTVPVAQISQVSIPTKAEHSGPVPGYLDPAVWKTFVSPNTVFKLYANKETGMVRVVKPNEPEPAQPWVQIPTLSSVFHLTLANNYAATLSPDTKREAFTQTLVKPQWWNEIQAVTIQLGIATEWNGYRRREILKKYRELLQSAGVPVATTGHATPRFQPVPSPKTPQNQTDTPDSTSVSQLREIVLRAVKRMSVSELRALAVPLGYIADELNLR
jgi:hypothetical protein